MTIPSDSVRRSILVYSIVMLLVATVAVAVSGIFPLYRQLRSANEDKILSLTRARAATARIFLLDAEESARQLAGRTGLRLKLEEYGKGDCSREEIAHYVQLSLYDAVANSPGIKGVLCLDAQGRPLARAGVEVPEEVVASAPSGKEFHQISALPLRLANTVYLLMRVPVRGGENQLVGWQVVIHGINELRAKFDEGIDIGESEETILGWFPDDKAEVFFRVGDSGLSQTAEASQIDHCLQLANAGQRGMLRIPTTKAPFVLAYAPVPGTGWALCINETENALLDELHRLIDNLIFLVAIILLAGIAGMVLLLRPLAGKLIIRTQDMERQILQRTEDLRREREQLLRLTKQVKAVNEELDAFTRTAAHDLRTPLVSIKGFAELLLLSEFGEKDPETKDALTRIVNGASRANRLIDALLDYARAGKIEPHREQVNLSAIANEIMAELHVQDTSRNVQIDIPENLLAYADSGLMHIALQNLLGNAWKYTSRIKAARIEFGEITRDGKRVFRISDNGVGFDMLYAEQLFEPFRRLHTEKEYAGTGIGLSTVQRIIERHGGQIWAESRVGVGTTFFFWLNEENNSSR
jgi:signal transduction histidine kinase